MADVYNEGDVVEWDWGTGVAKGKIESVHTTKVAKTINGSDVVREADRECPAYTIKQDDGDTVLKSHSEVRKA